MRIAILGGPGCGKSTLASGFAEHHPHIWHTDSLLHTVFHKHDAESWSQQSDEVAGWFDQPGPWVIEGVPVVRALRKWIQRNPKGRPCDSAVPLFEPKKPLESRQLIMLRGALTVWEWVEPQLQQRGVLICRI